jgi:drug/metabolite transporter (DMT)-like permease
MVLLAEAPSSVQLLGASTIVVGLVLATVRAGAGRRSEDGLDR